jgi:signal transduction histidine kinase
MLPTASPDKRADYEAALQQETEHLSRLVENILHINTLSTSGLNRPPQPVSLNLLVEEYVLRSCKAITSTGGPTVIADLADESPAVRIDQRWLVEALCQIIDNAVRYTPESGTITIATSHREEQDRLWATVEVTDTGVGIPPEEQSQVFDRFFRGQQADKEQISGTGLGLSIAQAVTELHGGRVTVRSELGKGSTFTVWLPAAEPAHSQSQP